MLKFIDCKNYTNSKYCHKLTSTDRGKYRVRTTDGGTFGVKFRTIEESV